MHAAPRAPCHEAVSEIARGMSGMIGLAAALFLIVWSRFDGVVVLAGMAMILTAGRRASGSGHVTADTRLVNQLRLLAGPLGVGWRLLALVACLALLVALAAARIAGGLHSAAASDAERWLALN